MTDYAMPPTPDGVDEFAWRAAVSAVRGYCRWHIAPSVTEILTVDGPGGYLLLLPTLHLTGVSSVINDGEELDLADTDKLQWSEMGAIRSARCWTSKWRGVQVEVTHGYPDFPHEVLAVARDMARQDGRIGAAAMASGPHSIQFGVTGAGVQAGAVGMSDLQKDVLDRYRIGGRP